MATSNIGDFTNGVADYTRRCILEPIVAHLNGRGAHVTVAELEDVLKLPSRTLAPAVPSMPFGGGVAGITPSVQPTRSKSANVPAQAEQIPGTCSYKYKRGDKAGKYCCRALAQGNPDYCNACAKAQNKKAASATPSVAGDFAGLQPAKEEQGGGLTVDPFDESRSLYQIRDTDIIIHHDAKSTTLMGHINQANNTIEAPNERDIEYARRNNITVNPVVAAAPAAAPASHSFMSSINSFTSLPGAASATPSLGTLVGA